MFLDAGSLRSRRIRTVIFSSVKHAGYLRVSKIDKRTPQTDSPAASCSGFRCATQFAANCQWDLYHMDLKTAFPQGEAHDETRDTICQIPAECGYPPHIGAEMKKSAYGLNDAPRRSS